MPQKRKTRQTLKKGDNVVATVEDIVHNHDCLIVSFIFQNRKYCGALMDTSKKGAPYGISAPIENEQETNLTDSKFGVKNPFPQPLLLRQSFHQDVPQPPLRNIFRRTRRSRRKVKLNILQQTSSKHKDTSTHEPSCTCKYCSRVSKSNKRKIDENKFDGPVDEKLKRLKYSDDTPSTSSDEESSSRHLIREEITSPMKSLMPGTIQSRQKVVQRSPVIKITFNTPGGKGKVVKIPSRPHVSPVKELQSEESSKNVYLTKKRICKQQTLGYSKLSATSGEEKPKIVKRKYRKRQYVGQLPDIAEGSIGLDKIKFINKKNTKQDQAMKVLKRVKRNSFSANVAVPHNKQETSSIGNPSYNKDLRVVLKPIDGRNGYLLPPQSCKLSDIVTQDLAEVFEDLDGNQEDFKGFTCQKMDKKPDVPKSHTLSVTSCKTPNGLLTHGDVVWGKLTGYPWWPSRVTKLIVTKTDGKILQQEAIVAWFQSRTTSTISVRNVESFQKSFNVRFQKKRKGLYQKAVADARSALKEITPEVRKLISQFET
uniref:PWWP domain-containing protein 2A n=1 Tax=Phallusia mammillata TaxID=59560 RepID=A0A6F9DPG2_9ASCI|nr:PWWP domain-containing protein 2A [Phallusia mammillata]